MSDGGEMPAAHPSAEGVAARRRAGLFYTTLLAVLVAALAARPDPGAFVARPLALAALLALSACGYAATHRPLALMGRVFDLTAALGLVAVVIAGPLGFIAVSVLPDLIHLARRRREFLHVGLLANLTAWVGEAVAAAAILQGAHDAGVLVRVALLLTAGLATLALNYLLARLLLVVLRDRESPLVLVRREFLTALAPAALSVAVGVLCAMLLPAIGVPVFAAFIAVASLPEIVAARLLRAPSVAALAVDDAAAVYRDALADELGLPRPDRRLVHLVDALVQRHPLPESTPRPAAAIQDALIVTMCAERAPTQPHFSASVRSQVVLVARQWARLTARCTPALNHREALLELCGSGLAQDAPLALAAAARIIAREDGLTEHVAGVPRLHRAPLPRALRHDVLPDALGRLAA